jgi:hypothetical protein
MSALTAARVVLVEDGTIKKFVAPLKAGSTAWEGGVACIDSASTGSVTQGAVSTTLLPIGKFIQSVNNSAGGTTLPVGIELQRERNLTYLDSVTGGNAVTSANLFQKVYLTSDHELSTSSSGNSKAGLVWAVGPQGYPAAVGVEFPFDF